MKLRLLLASALIALAACTSVGVPTPDTLSKKIYVAEESVASVRDTTAALLTAGKITKADAINVQAQADNFKAGFALARGLIGTDLASAQGKFDATNKLLLDLQAYLTAKQGAAK